MTACGPTSEVATPIRAIIYRRISLDRTGEEAGITRQETDCRAYCARQGWTVVADFEDNHISASRYAKKKRPGYAAAIRLIEARGADALVAYHLDRLWRQPSELETLIDMVEKSNLIVATLTGDMDLMTGDGRLHARILVSVAAAESDNMSRRIRRSKEAMAREGMPASCVRAFGWNEALMEDGVRKGPRGGTVIIPDQAEAIRDGARRFLAGEPLNEVARRWNAAGFGGLRGGGGGWNGGSVRVVLANPRHAALRYYKGEYVGKAVWPAILDELTWRRIRTKLADPARAHAPRKVTLLTGLLVCGREGCGHRLTRRTDPSGTALYICHLRVSLGLRGCGRLGVVAVPLEQYVVDALLGTFDGPRVSQVGQPRSPRPNEELDTSEIAALEARLAELADAYADGAVTMREWLTARDRIEARFASVRKHEVSTGHQVALEPYVHRPGLLRERWEHHCADERCSVPELTLHERRVLIAAAIDRVVINPAKRRGRAWDPDRVVIQWRT